MTRDGSFAATPDRRKIGKRPSVSAKGPTALVAKFTSRPSSVSLKSCTMHPALFTRTCRGSPESTYAVTTDGGGDFDIRSDQTAAELWFTFSGGQHASISWDPSTGYGDLGESSGVLTPASIVGIVLGSIAAVSLVGAAAVYGVRKYRRGNSKPGSPGLGGSSNAAAGYGAIPSWRAALPGVP